MRCAIDSMVHHVVLFRFRTDLPAGAIEAVFDELRGFRQSIPGITGFQGGAYNSAEGLSRGFTHGFTMIFEDESARDAYLPHPLHPQHPRRYPLALVLPCRLHLLHVPY